jgi:hypothetical protein
MVGLHRVFHAEQKAEQKNRNHEQNSLAGFKSAGLMMDLQKEGSPVNRAVE